MDCSAVLGGSVTFYISSKNMLWVEIRQKWMNVPVENGECSVYGCVDMPPAR